jgi:hypothetical protein
MTSKKNFSYGIIALLVLLVFFGIALADPMVNQTPEIQGFKTTTTMDVVGLANENDAIGWQLSNGAVNSGSLAIPGNFYKVGPYVIYIPGGDPVYNAMYGNSNSSGQVQYTVAYDETTTAFSGAVTYNKGLSLNTGNKVASQNNVQADKIVTFEGNDAGTIVSSESIMVDGAGQFDWTASKMLCPFAASTSTLIPPFCNIVQTGSSVDLTTGRFVTSTHERSVAATSDPGVEAGHDIDVTGIGNGPALGSAAAYIKVHDQEGRAAITYLFIGATEFDVHKTEDLQYSETSLAFPTIAKFSKSMDYKSGLNSL